MIVSSTEGTRAENWDLIRVTLLKNYARREGKHGMYMHMVGLNAKYTSSTANFTFKQAHMGALWDIFIVCFTKDTTVGLSGGH